MNSLISEGDGKNKDGKDGKNGKADGNGKALCDAKGHGKVDNELQQNQATDEQIEGICELLRSNKVDQALQFMQKDILWERVFHRVIFFATFACVFSVNKRHG